MLVVICVIVFTYLRLYALLDILAHGSWCFFTNPFPSDSTSNIIPSFEEVYSGIHGCTVFIIEIVRLSIVPVPEVKDILLYRANICFQSIHFFIFPLSHIYYWGEVHFLQVAVSLCVAYWTLTLEQEMFHPTISKSLPPRNHSVRSRSLSRAGRHLDDLLGNLLSSSNKKKD